jgi:hypothetical protein
MLTETINITFFPASDNSHGRILVDQNMTIKALSPNNMIGRRLTTQNRVTPLKCLKRIRDIIKMKVAHNTKDRQAKLFFPESSKACTTKAFSY